VGFIHGSTSTNPYNRLRSLIPLFEDSYCFLSCLKFVSQPGIWVENEVMAALEKEQQHPKPVLFPIKLDELVMQTSLPWAASIRRTRHSGDFTRWKNHDAYRKAFDHLLRDLKAEAKKGK